MEIGVDRVKIIQIRYWLNLTYLSLLYQASFILKRSI